MNKKMTVLAGAITSVLSASALAGINDIIITEYVEGSSNNKAIEISNLGGNSFDLTGNLYLFKGFSTYKNIIQNKDGSPVLDGVTLQPGKSIVVIDPSASSDLRRYAERNGGDKVIVASGSFEQVSHSALTFNGDDPVWLSTDVKGNADKVHDIVGIYGFSDKSNDPWKDQTLRRNTLITTPSATFTEGNWSKEAKDAFGGLGDPAKVDDSPLPPLAAACDESKYDYKIISDIQGAGFRSPLIAEGSDESEQEYLVKGIVSAVTKDIDKGFFLFDSAESSEHGEFTSKGIFVSTKKDLPADFVGQEVCVRAKVKEYKQYKKDTDSQTTLIPTSDDVYEVVNATPVSITPVALEKIAEDGDSFSKTLERYEGMVVKLVSDMDKVATGDQDMRVTRSFSFDFAGLPNYRYRNNMVLAYERVNRHPNQDHVAGSEASLKQAAENADRLLFVDSDVPAPNGQIPYYPAFRAENGKNTHLEDYIRVNDSLVDLEGVIQYGYGEYRMVPTNTIDKSKFERNTPRKEIPTLNTKVGDNEFAITIATQNVLNYFNSPFGGATNQHGANRGAETDLEFERQEEKIVKAILGLNADVIGLMEIENNGFGDLSSIRQLLRKVNNNFTEGKYSKKGNADSVYNRYTFVGFDSNGDTVLDALDSIGGDVITTGLIYRPSKVSLQGAKVIPMPSQNAPRIEDKYGNVLIDQDGAVRESGKNYQRNTIAATFKVLNTGKTLTVAVNHLKSKGSTCWEDWQGWETWSDFSKSNKYSKVKNDDYQGSCENFRVAAAYQLGEQMAKIGGDQVVLGDMNSYAKEDPMLLLTSNPTGKVLKTSSYTNINGRPMFGKDEGQTLTKTYGYLNAVELEEDKPWSYSYETEVGSLDHMLITPSLKDRLIDATDWHINAPETSVIDYSNYKKVTDDEKEAGMDLNPFYSNTAYRSSDHDSAIIALKYSNLEAGVNPVTMTATGGYLEVPFVINVPDSVEADAKVKKYDVAEISVSPMPENFTGKLPTKMLYSAKNQTVNFKLLGIDKGTYTFTMKLKGKRDKAVESGAVTQAAAVTETETRVIAQQSMTVEVIKADAMDPKPAVPEYDGSGGSGGAFGLGGLFALFGFGFLRRRRQ
ncbi:ExeM/NucH family extracellular endonuclease [Vibrio tapetis]|uniref:Endonuclease/Exonuclease/phosphatase family protein n=1 Tax=Vibrio tapetis subsp. tapetis TaxID=1671868 RepID=A0A2N8ZG94_9VIBR|nr:ExeM/NucH family extracellular endonuclease [Vibrio tapetis]SON50920.1 Endonuclease/Exonuclease/phosphatase family protein [Vibrio tapetis subsp. tapetis]